MHKKENEARPEKIGLSKDQAGENEDRKQRPNQGNRIPADRPARGQNQSEEQPKEQGGEQSIHGRKQKGTVDDS